MQPPPDRHGQCSSDALRVILLQRRNRVAYLIRKDAVDRAAIVAQPRQVALQRADVSGLRNQLSARFEVIKRPPVMSWRKIGCINGGSALMNETPLIAGSQSIGVMKKRPIKDYVVEVGT